MTRKVEKGNSQHPVLYQSVSSNKEAEGPNCTPSRNSEEEIKHTADLNFCLITLWYGLLWEEHWGLWMEKLNRCFLLECWHLHEHKMTWEDVNFHSALKLSWFMGQQQLWVSICTTQSRETRIYQLLGFPGGFLLNMQLEISLHCKLGWHKLAKKGQSVIDSSLIKGFSAHSGSCYWQGTFLFRMC